MTRGTPEARWLAVYGAAVVAYTESAMAYRARCGLGCSLDDLPLLNVVVRARMLADAAERAASEADAAIAARDGHGIVRRADDLDGSGT